MPVMLAGVGVQGGFHQPTAATGRWGLVLAWAILGQAIAPVQVAGALLVVGTVMGLGLRRR